MIEITGHYKPIERLITGLYTFDRAFRNAEGDIGFPQGKLTEVYGPTHIGKSTAVYGIAALLAKNLETNIALVDLEDFDPAFLKSVMSTGGFTGSVHSILEDSDEKSLDSLIEIMIDDGYGVGILDSIGAISPVSEREGDLGEANMGRRAKLMAAFSRKALFLLRSSKTHKNIFMINHQHSPIGGLARTPYAPGGNTKEYLSSMRIQTRRPYLRGKDTEFPDGSYIIEGRVVKNRWGIKGDKFYLFVLSGKGLHVGLTAFWDCLMLDKLGRGGAYYKIGDETIGLLKDIIEKGHEGDDEFFQPFFDLLKEHNDK